MSDLLRNREAALAARITGCGPRLDARQFAVVRFGYPRGEMPEVLLGLSVHMPLQLPGWARPTLVIERDAVDLLYTARVATAERTGSREPQWLWRGIFPVPRELASDPDAVFALRLFDEFRLALPLPFELDATQMGSDPQVRARARKGRSWPYAVRRTALLFVVTCQLCVVPALMSPGASGAGLAGSTAGVEAAPEGAKPPHGCDPSAPTSEAPPAPPAGGSGEAPCEKPPPSPEHSEKPPAEPPAKPKPETPANAPGAGGREAAPAPAAPSTPVLAAQKSQPSERPVSPANTGKAGAGGHSPHKGSSDAKDGARKPRSGSERSHKGEHRAAARHHSHAAPAGKHRGRSHARLDVSDSWRAALPAAQAPSGSVAPAPEAVELPPPSLRLPPGFEGLAADSPPAYLIPIYQDAGRRYGVPWTVLAAINQIETDYGRNLSVSSAGAEGWMQFMPETWSRWAVDADQDGQLNPYSPLDAIFTAARYLQASGAETDLPGAILAYNHAGWYVSEVLMRARMLEGGLTSTGSEKGYALPLDAPYMQTLGRTDDGVDIETAPDGALVYSITPGVVTAVASDPSGFGPNYPVIQASSGALTGADIYYGHVAKALVVPGQHVGAGQPIAVMGHTGDAVSLGHGHIEIGFSDAGGDPLDHHGATAWTPAGEVMRSFLVTLTAAFRAQAHDARAVAARARTARTHKRARHGEQQRRPGVEPGL